MKHDLQIDFLPRIHILFIGTKTHRSEGFKALSKVRMKRTPTKLKYITRNESLIQIVNHLPAEVAGEAYTDLRLTSV